MHFSRDSCVSSVLESSCMPYTLRFSVRGFLALTRKLLFLEAPLYILGHISTHYSNSFPLCVNSSRITVIFQQQCFMRNPSAQRERR